MMKTSVILCVVSGILFVASVFLVALGYSYSEQFLLKQKLIASENKIFLIEKSNSMLEGEIRNLEYTLSTTRKYEDGYRDALVRLDNPQLGTFDEGYEAAKKVYGSGSYTDGYHAAIEQLSCSLNKNKEQNE